MKPIAFGQLKLGFFVSKANESAIPKMAVFPGLFEWSRTLRVRCDAAVTWGFPDLSAGLPRPSLLFDGRRKKRLRLWCEGRKKEGRRRWERREGIFALRWNLRGKEGSPPVSLFLSERRLVSVPLCRCVSPLVGQKKKKTGFGECRSSVVNC